MNKNIICEVLKEVVLDHKPKSRRTIKVRLVKCDAKKLSKNLQK